VHAHVEARTRFGSDRGDRLPLDVMAPTPVRPRRDAPLAVDTRGRRVLPASVGLGPPYAHPRPSPDDEPAD
jgi:hypothetical protein